MFREIIHYSDWASQPEVRIACNQEYHYPWTKRKDLPEGVYEISFRDSPSIFYTFNKKLTTCDKCKLIIEKVVKYNETTKQ